MILGCFTGRKKLPVVAGNCCWLPCSFPQFSANFRGWKQQCRAMFGNFPQFFAILATFGEKLELDEIHRNFPQFLALLCHGRRNILHFWAVGEGIVFDLPAIFRNCSQLSGSFAAFCDRENSQESKTCLNWAKNRSSTKLPAKNCRGRWDLFAIRATTSSQTGSLRARGRARSQLAASSLLSRD